VNMPQIRATAIGGGSDLTGYISGSNNFINSNFAGIFLNTGSLLFPKTQNNTLSIQSSIGMNFTTSSLAGGHPLIQSNILNGGTITLNSNSGSINVNNNIIAGGSIVSTQNFVTNVRAVVVNNNVIGGVTLNHISSSILYTSNYNNSPVTINNFLSSSNIANNSLTVTNNAILGGSSNTPHNIYVSGSQSSNVTRTIGDNLIGGRSNVVSSSFVSSSNSNLTSTIIYGNNLAVSGSHIGNGGSAFFGRFNATGSLQESTEDTVFVVGSGTGAGARRNALRIDNNSNSSFTGSVNISGSLTLNGSSVGDRTGLITTGSIGGAQTITGSLAVSGGFNVSGVTNMSDLGGFPLNVIGTINSQRLNFNTNPFNTNPSSNIGAIRLDGSNTTFYSTNYDSAEITTQSQVFQTVNTGSGIVDTGLESNNYGTNYYLSLKNSVGTGSLITNANTIITGSLAVTNKIVNNVTVINALATATASLDLNSGSTFWIEDDNSPVGLNLEASNLTDGQQVFVSINTTTTQTVSAGTNVDFANGSSTVEIRSGANIFAGFSYGGTLYLK
jgi:hypothetical protein